MNNDLKKFKKLSNSNKITYKCQLCRDSGHILSKDKEGRIIDKECLCLVKIRAIKLMIASGLSAEDSKLSFKDFKCDVPEQKSCLVAAMNYAQNFRGIRYDTSNSMLLTGRSGKGKTLLSIITMNYLISNGIYVLYASYRDTFSQLKRDLVHNATEYERKLTELKEIELLILDDLFKGKISDADFSIAMELINYRYQKRLPMIISTEMSINDLLQIDEAIGGRIKQMCNRYTLYFGDAIKNYRLENQLI